LRWIKAPRLAVVLLSTLRQKTAGDMKATSKDSRELGFRVPMVLVVDDDVAVLNSLKFCLEIEGFVVKLYGDAQALLNEPDLPSFGCLVIDYSMPDMTGLELLAQLRSDGIELPAILITGHPGLAVRRRAAEVGVVIVEKPLFGNGLTEAIRGAVDNRVS
jgi:two-component system, LuxR family, response regulator FixJ